MTGRIVDMLSTTEPLAEVFSDVSVIQAMLDVEAALARVEGRLGIIPPEAAGAIAAAASAGTFDAAALAREGRRSGTLVAPLVAALTGRVRATDANAARFVHWGATSQDIADTALVRLIGRARARMAPDHAQLSNALRVLSDRHAADVMLGRTLLQAAPPITFGLKAAAWLAGVGRGWSRLSAAVAEVSVVQFGGASGTLAALADRGLLVAEALARELDLACPEAPWHTYRDRLAAVVSACGIYTGLLGKVARDISLLMQTEVGEAAESGGGSSTMPHKQNPAGCALVLAAAARLPGLVSASVAGLVQEHERSAGAWHAEWPTSSEAVQTTGAALSAMAAVVAGLTVDPRRMRANLDATNGEIFAERVMMLAGPALGRDAAHAMLQDVVARSRAAREPIGRVLRATPELARVLSKEDLETIDDPAAYLGVAEALRRRLLASAAALESATSQAAPASDELRAHLQE
jgi:3-carboxy-cis,cis-muconate cycloisomerase